MTWGFCKFSRARTHECTRTYAYVASYAKTLHVSVLYTNSCKILIVLSIFTCFILKFSWIICQLTIIMQISTTLQETVKEFWHFKVLRMGQNLHANMEGFQRFAEPVTYCNLCTK